MREGLAQSQTILLRYAWPGNIRELRNMMERLALFLSVEPQPSLDSQFYSSFTRAGDNSRSAISAYARSRFWRSLTAIKPQRRDIWVLAGRHSGDD